MLPPTWEQALLRVFGSALALAGFAKLAFYLSLPFTHALLPYQDSGLYWCAGIGAAAALVWNLSGRAHDSRYVYLLAALIRHQLCFSMVMYGAAKVVPLQFSEVIYSRLDSRAFQLHGADKAWLFFGHSDSYCGFLGGGEVVGALLLLPHRTVLLGACILVAILSNVVWANATHEIGVLLDSSFFLAQAGFLLLCDARRLLHFFFNLGPTEPTRPPEMVPRLRLVSQLVFLLVMAAYNVWHLRVLSSGRQYTAPLAGIWVNRDREAPIQRLRLENGYGSAVLADEKVLWFSYDYDPETKKFELNFRRPQRGVTNIEAQVTRGLGDTLVLTPQRGTASTFQPFQIPGKQSGN